MAQQMVNGSHYDGDVTFTYPMSERYAVVGEPFHGKHSKSQTDTAKAKRRLHWVMRNKSIYKKGKSNDEETFVQIIG